MSRVPHPSKRCDTCEFWAHGDQWPPSSKEDKYPGYLDDRIGSCHRNAPPASLGDFEYELLYFLTQLMPEEGVNFENWEEAALQRSTWPSTGGGDWCGEWQAKTWGEE